VPKTVSVPPARNTSASSIESAPAAIAWQSVSTLRPGRAAPARSQGDELVDQPLDPQPPAQRGDQHQPRVGEEPLVVELDPDRVGRTAAPEPFTM
jgi:hypothetical protein